MSTDRTTTRTRRIARGLGTTALVVAGMIGTAGLSPAAAAEQSAPPPPAAYASPATTTTPASPEGGDFWADDLCHYFPQAGYWHSDMCYQYLTPTQVALVPRTAAGMPAAAALIVLDTSNPEYSIFRFPTNPLFATVQWMALPVGGGAALVLVTDTAVGQSRWVPWSDVQAALQTGQGARYGFPSQSNTWVPASSRLVDALWEDYFDTQACVNTPLGYYSSRC